MMRVDVTKNVYSNNTYNSMLPLIWILKIFALNCKVDETLKSSNVLIKKICTSLIIGCINFYCLYYKINNVYFRLDLSIKVTDMVQIISDYFQYIVDLYFVYKYGGDICVEYFKQFDIFDKFLNVVCFSAMKRKLLKLMMFFITIWIISSFSDLAAWVITYGWMIPITHSVSYLFLFIKMMTMLDLIAHVTHIEVRLRIVNNLVLNCYNHSVVSEGGLMADCVRNKNWLYNGCNTKTLSLKAHLKDRNDINRLTKCYLLLIEQVAYINKMYGFRILLNMLSLLLDMVKIMNLGIRIAIGSQRTLYNSAHYYYLPGISGFVRMITCAIIIITLVYHCEEAYRQRDQIINIIDHLLVNKNPDAEIRSVMVNLRTLSQERPVCFNMANFFTLNFPLLVSISSVVVTYTIILLQSVN